MLHDDGRVVIGLNLDQHMKNVTRFFPEFQSIAIADELCHRVVYRVKQG